MQSAVTPEKPDEIPWMKDLASCTNQMKKEGYKEDFQVNDEGLMSTFNNATTFKANEVSIVSFYRFEGVSDPGDNTILYLIETNDGTKGTLVDGYGAYADENVAKFIVEVEKIQKVKISDLQG